jgi:DNA-binding transcriptional LysR family regulator
LGINLFERHRKGVALTPAGKSFLIDARSILADCAASIRKSQRISRGEIGELAIGYMSALTHEFLGQALEVWRLTGPDICRRLHRNGLYIAGEGAIGGAHRRGLISA